MEGILREIKSLCAPQSPLITDTKKPTRDREVLQGLSGRLRSTAEGGTLKGVTVQMGAAGLERLV